MGEIEFVTRIFYGWRCDNNWVSRRQAEANMAADGWSIWVSRSLHVYCPEHGPSRGSKKMRRVTP